MTITEFLTARWDEEEHDWRVVAAREVVEMLHGRPLAPMMLADIAAKRAIVALHGVKETVWTKVDGMAPFIERNCTTCGESHWSGFEPADWPCPTLLALAQPYADHPDFGPEWRV